MKKIKNNQQVFKKNRYIFLTNHINSKLSPVSPGPFLFVLPPFLYRFPCPGHSFRENPLFPENRGPCSACIPAYAPCQ
jgi:hypothetical protein